MAGLYELVGYADGLLQVERFQDYAPNGLQVEGRVRVERLVTGVTACQAFIEAAQEAGADALLVHHGYFWRGESPVVSGMKRHRLRSLLGADLSLLAYHLPLDAHPVYGNNARLAAELDLSVEGGFGPGPDSGIAMYGSLSEPLAPGVFADFLAERLGRAPLHVPGGGERVYRVGWCTGAAQDYLEQAAALRLDAYISGEVSERTVHEARELGIHYFAAGHHATERYGVQALGEHLAERFGIEHRFIDIDNPV